MHNNAWTGGQYSIFRFLFGIYLFVHFIQLVPWGRELFSSDGMIPNASDSPLIYFFPNILAIFDNPLFIMIFIISAVISSIGFALGYKDRICAVWMWFVLACIFGRNPLIANPSLPYAGWMLLAHVFITSKPYGSIAAKDRADPAGGWYMPKHIFIAGWIVLAISYSYSGYTKLLSPSWVAGENINYVLNNPLARDYFLRDFFLWVPPIFLQLLTWSVLYIELLFAPLALIPRLRPILWLAMLIIQFGFAFLLNFPDLTAAMVLFHIFTFNPAWVKPKKPKGDMVLYYDGNCALCHNCVRFLLAEDSNSIFKFSPLQSQKFQNTLTEEERQKLPDSIVLLTDDKNPKICSSAVISLLLHLGGMWKIIGATLWLIPKPIRDLGYKFVGSIRYKIFGKTQESCPIIPEALQDRFL